MQSQFLKVCFLVDIVLKYRMHKIFQFFVCTNGQLSAKNDNIFPSCHDTLSNCKKY